jgi:penicillin amidase
MGRFEGSNSWVTAASRNQVDYPILSNDPHLALTNPSLWYLNELDAKSQGQGSFHAVGVTFAGFPGVHIGYTEEVAWSATVAFWDLSDVYVEELSEDGQGVMFNGEVVPFVRRTDTIEYATGAEEVEQLFVPHHGPVVAYDAEAGVAVSVKTVLQDARQDVDFFLGLGRMTSMEQAREHFKLSQAAAFSFVLASRDGQIGYFPYADLPRRDWDTTAMPPRYPLPGTGGYEWGEYLDKDALPQLLNPEAGFIATANAGITDDTLDGDLGNQGYPVLQDPGLYRGARQARIVDMIQEQGDQHTLESHMRMQADDTLWEAQELVPEILTSSQGAQLSPEAAAVREVLANWDMSCPTGLASTDPQGEASADEAERSASVGCSAYHVTLFSLSDLMIGDEVQAADADAAPSYYEMRPLYWALKDPSQLANEAGWWDNVNTDGPDETREDIVAAALERAAGELEGLFGSAEPSAWLWGRIHTLTLQPDLLNTLTDEFNNGPYAGPGGYGAVNVANPEVENGYAYDAGPSMRMIVEVRPEGMVGRFALPGGLVHRRDAENYDNLLQRWLAVEYFEMPFTVEQVDAASTEKVEVQPEP